MVYKSWRRFLDDSLEIVPVELSGRGTRLKEKLYESFEEAVGDAYRSIRALRKTGVPYALFGHSMGSWLVFELAKKLFATDGLTDRPQHIFFSGNFAPHTRREENRVSNLPDDEFWEYIYAQGGVPTEIYHNCEFREFYIPILKSDYKIIEEYSCHKNMNQKLGCNITVLSGRNDEISEDELAEWSIYAGKDFNIKWFDGGHFFLTQRPWDVCNYLNYLATSYLNKRELVKELR